MNPHANPGEIIHEVIAGTSNLVLDVLGPTVEFLTSPAAAHGDFCVMRGVIPPGVAVPLHSHDATEVFFVLSGTKQVLTLGSGPAEWVDVHAGDYVHVPRGTRHAHRNVSDEPLIELVITTAGSGTGLRRSAPLPRVRPGRRQPPTWTASSPPRGGSAPGSVPRKTTPPSGFACRSFSAPPHPANDAPSSGTG
jgi:quercetin dioxygenase-like cupin family protein